MASGSGSLTLIDAVSNAVTLQGTPGVADVFLGDMDPTLFFNRSYTIDPGDINQGIIGDLSISITTLGLPVTTSAQIGASATALGEAPLADSLVFNGPFPETQTFGNSATFITSLLNTLVTNLNLTIEGTLGGTLDPLVNSVILPALAPIVTDAISPVLNTVLVDLVDPTLGLLGVGIGEMDATVAPLIPVVPPQANDDFVSTNAETSVTISVFDNDAAAAGDAISIVSTTDPTNGSIVVNPDGTITYTPNTGYAGSDSFTYTITGPGGGTTSATVLMDVQSTNTAPVAQPDAYAVDEDGSLTVDAAGGVLANDDDADGDALTAVLETGPTNGTLTLNADGSFTYTPNAGFVGSDSFTYRAFDGVDHSDPVAVAITVNAAAGQNTAPVANPDSYAMTQDGALAVSGPGVLANDVDADGDALIAVLATGPSYGTLTLNPDGSFTYTPNAGYVGGDSFSYRAFDGENYSEPVAVTIAVNAAPPTNTAPVANPDIYEAPQDGTLQVPGPGVLGNDFDPDGAGLSAVVDAGPSNGTLVLNPDGSFSYTPNPGYVGSDSFSYRASDGELLSDPVWVSINVIAAAGPPMVVGVERYGFHNQPTLVTIAFSAPLDPATAQDVSNYELIGPGRDGRFGTRDDVRYVIASATYDAATQSVTLAPNRLLALRSNYQVIVRDGVMGVGGVPLDGNGDGTPGGWAMVGFNQSALVGPSVFSQRPTLANRGPLGFAASPPQRPLPTIRGPRAFAAFAGRAGLRPMFNPIVQGVGPARLLPPARLSAGAPFGPMR